MTCIESDIIQYESHKVDVHFHEEEAPEEEEEEEEDDRLLTSSSSPEEVRPFSPLDITEWSACTQSIFSSNVSAINGKPPPER